MDCVPTRQNFSEIYREGEVRYLGKKFYRKQIYDAAEDRHCQTSE